MYPHERSLVTKYQGRPFAIVGVNSDSNREELKKVAVQENITWRSFWNGGSPGGPIAEAWGVHGWPTLYLIDHNGVIITEGLSDAKIEKAVQAAEAARK
jgi:Thioredoxin-like